MNSVESEKWKRDFRKVFIPGRHFCSLLPMKYLYPTAHLIEHLSPSLLSLKIARHSSCSLCSCSGLNPPPGIQVVPDDQPSESSLGDLGQYGSDEEENPMYLSSCACSHSASQHGANEHEIGSEEFRRRSLVAIRLDELLQVRTTLATARQFFSLKSGANLFVS